jgi:ectoine hydroxylase-related dioxygenase (phytanoyl-CoA dioxygenase family)
MAVTESARTEFERDGVTFLPGALPGASLRLAEEAFAWSLAHPGPAASSPFEGTGDGSAGHFYQDLCNPAAPTHPTYTRLLRESPVASLVADLWRQSDVWFMYEQVFLKEGGESRRTPWHQDAPYLSVEGEHLAVAWITFDEVPAADSLEFVRGSHRSTLFNTSAFDPDDETIPIHDGLPRLPDIQAERNRWDIVSWAVTPGDLIVFHPALLHGGAATHPGGRRRTLSLRFFGPDATYVTRPGGGVAPMVEGLHERLRDGDPFRDPAFPKLDIRAIPGTDDAGA